MAITLTNGAASMALPPDLIWTNEFQWTPIVQASERSITGALILDTGVKTGGRPIVLQGAENTAWLLRAEARALLDAWVSLPGQVFTLTLNGRALQVVFDHEAGPLELKPVVDYSDPIDNDYYCGATLRFLEI